MGKWWGCRLFSGPSRSRIFFAPQITFFFLRDGIAASPNLHLSTSGTPGTVIFVFTLFSLGGSEHQTKVSQRLIFGGNAACQLRAMLFLVAACPLSSGLPELLTFPCFSRFTSTSPYCSLGRESFPSLNYFLFFHISSPDIHHERIRGGTEPYRGCRPR